MDAVRNILRERQILETLDHAFVVNMRFAFQDDEYMYMCMDLMMGGDLRFHLNRKQFGEDVVRFWIAELCSALTHLHSQGIVHRDIKPDNVLLDEKGHAHLTDFNIGCKLTAEKPFLTSQSGTVAYMAPEVFGRHGYGTSVDWWAIGVLFYECIYNKRPFQTESINDLKKAIPTQTIEFPEKEGLSRECISAMRGFLTRDPKERLGIKGGMDGVRQHPFFQAGAYQTNPDNWWYMLETKQLTPKFQPSSENVNFDATYDLEELLLDDEPLTYRSTRKRAQRMQKEKEKAIKEENARIKAEQQQEAAAAAAAAELAMLSGMALDDYYVIQNNIKESGMFPQKQEKHNQKKVAKKRSKIYLGGGNSVGNKVDSESSSGNNNSQVHLSQPPIIPHPYHSQSAAEPGSGPGPGGATSQAVRRGTSMPAPSLQFPTLPPPSASPQSGRHMHHHSNGGYSRHHPSSSLPPPPTQGLPLNPTQLNQANSGNKHSLDSLKGNNSIAAAGGGVQSGSTATGYSYSTAGTPGHGVTAIYLSKPAIPSANGTYTASPSYKGPAGQLPVKDARRAYCAEDDLVAGKGYPGSASQQIQQRYQQKHQQQQYASTSTSSSSSIGAPSSLPHPLPSRNQQQNHIPPHHQQQKQQQYNQQQQQHAPIQRQASPLLVAATEVAAAKANAGAGHHDHKDATASANMSRKEKIAHQMALIDREFLTFDYTVYESYHGLIDPLTMSVGDPPEWVRSRDH
ncbi:hypothetical protein BGX33_010038 [Mortierella sp. NVP41]|nr:hypothetical protein BGX33_010038 [Mortierella sp. NVP41]